MYFVDRKRIEELLQFLEKQLALLEQTSDLESEVEKAALERVCHTVIESMLDVGNAVIDGFIMRDPGSYHDIIDILEDEKVITEEMCKGIKRVIDYRKEIVQNYTNIDHAAMYETFLNELPLLKEFAPNVRRYLEDELGPVSAFRN